MNMEEENEFWTGTTCDGETVTIRRCPLCGEFPNINDCRIELDSYYAKCLDDCPNSTIVDGCGSGEGAAEAWNEVIELGIKTKEEYFRHYWREYDKAHGRG